MADNEAEVFKLHRQGQERNDYFLLAAAATAIGFALTQTKDAHLVWQHAPLGVAVACWALSFYLGCRRLNYVDASLHNNMTLIQVERGKDPEIGRHPQMVAVASEALRRIMDDQGNMAARFARWQFRLLITGALFYIAWHVLQMYLRK